MNFAILAILILVSAALVSAGLIVLLRPVLQRYALARPNARSSHRIPTPQGGGIAVVAAILGIVPLALMQHSAELAGPQIALVLAATAFIAVVGAVDDIRPIPVLPRLVLQAFAAGVVIAALPDDLRLLSWLPLLAERALLAFALLWFVNLTNFMDGIDWMTVAEVVPVTGGLILIGLLSGSPDHATVCALALMGAAIGFAPFNKPVARLFLGDVGSLPIGLLLGWLLLLAAGRGHIAAALILPMYYVADATITLLRRIARHEPFWEAHRFHYYQQAVDRGVPAMTVVGRVFALNLALVALAVATVLIPGPAAGVAALVCGGVLVGLTLFHFARGQR